MKRNYKYNYYYCNKRNDNEIVLIITAAITIKLTRMIMIIETVKNITYKCINTFFRIKYEVDFEVSLDVHKTDIADFFLTCVIP